MCGFLKFVNTSPIPNTVRIHANRTTNFIKFTIDSMITDNGTTDHMLSDERLFETITQFYIKCDYTSYALLENNRTQLYIGGCGMMSYQLNKHYRCRHMIY